KLQSPVTMGAVDGLGQSEPAQHGKRLFGSKKWAAATSAPKHLALAETDDGEYQAQGETTRYQNEVHDGNGNGNDRDRDAGQQARTGALEAFCRREHSGFHPGLCGGGAESFEGNVQRLELHGLEVRSEK